MYLFLLPPVPLESSILRAGLLTSGPVNSAHKEAAFHPLLGRAFLILYLGAQGVFILGLHTIPVEQIFKNLSVKSDIFIFHSQLINSLTEWSSGLNFSQWLDEALFYCHLAYSTNIRNTWISDINVTLSLQPLPFFGIF